MKMVSTGYSTLIFILVIASLANIEGNELRLQHYLSKNFSSKARPVLNSRTPVVVTFGFELIQIVDVLETEQVIALKLWIRMAWSSPLLRWNPKIQIL